MCVHQQILRGIVHRDIHNCHQNGSPQVAVALERVDLITHLSTAATSTGVHWRTNQSQLLNTG